MTFSAGHWRAITCCRPGIVGSPTCAVPASSSRSGTGAQGSFADDAVVDIPANAMNVGAGRDAGARLIGLSPRSTAAFCANDLLALGVMQTAFDSGIRVPDDIAVVGYDDIEFAEACLIPLTSVRHPTGQIGRLAAGLLLEEIDARQPEHLHTAVVLRPELVVRRSSMSRR